MPVEKFEFTVKTNGFTDIINITDDVQRIIEKAKLRSGIATIFVGGSTASITTIEYEDGLIRDMITTFETIAPKDRHYYHHERWHDDNGSSHIRASLLGPSITIPFTDKKMPLGTWQQIVLIDFDTRKRTRNIIVQLIGE